MAFAATNAGDILATPIDTLLESLEFTEEPTPKNVAPGAPLIGLLPPPEHAKDGRLGCRRPSSPVLPRLSFSALSMRFPDGGSVNWPAQQAEGASVTSAPDSQWVPNTPLTAVTGRTPPTLAELQATASELVCFGDSFDAMLLVPVSDLPQLPPPLLAPLPSAGADHIHIG